MAVFTMELRSVDELYDVRKMALSNYPIFDEEYREELNSKILDHYWTREIGQETPQLFFRYLRRKMNEIMPMYNEYYKSARFKYDPMNTMDMRTITRGENDSHQTSENNSESTSLGKSDSRTVGSTYPQSALSGSEDYADSSTDTTGTTTGTEGASGTASAEARARSIGDSHSYGRSQSGMSIVQEFRDTIINVDMMIIDELEPMFMQIFSTGDFEPNEPSNMVSYSMMYGFPYWY